MSDPAFPRWLAITGVRVAAAFGGMLGVVLLGKARDLPTQALGVAIVIAALWVMASVPRALARRWKTPE